MYRCLLEIVVTSTTGNASLSVRSQIIEFDTYQKRSEFKNNLKTVEKIDGCKIQRICTLL